jgi:hypothetical protein
VICPKDHLLATEAPIRTCASAGFRQFIGSIDGANTALLRQHETCGTRQVDCLRTVAVRFGEWVGTMLGQWALGPEMRVVRSKSCLNAELLAWGTTDLG